MLDVNPPYDLVVFGATGFVGKILCHYLVGQIGTKDSRRWAVAGRDRAKLVRLLADLGPDAVNVGCIVADARDENSLQALCGQTRVVVTTVGPYALHGETLVKVCAEMGTDYCDLTGEIQWIRRMLGNYEGVAQRSGARIVHCCGFDSIPSDLGTYFLQQQAQIFFGDPCVRVKMRVMAARGGFSGGTVASGLQLAREAATSSEIRQELFNPYSLCPDTDEAPTIAQPSLNTAQYDPVFGGWVAPFVMAPVNTRIVLRSHALQGYPYGSEFQYDEAMWAGRRATGWAVAQGMTLALGGVAIAALFPPARSLLAAIAPSPGEGPTPAAQASGFYELQFWGRTADGREITVQVTGDRDPGYGSTAKILGQAGLTLAETPKSERPGGFWTPAALFGQALVERLIAHAGMTFTVL